MARAVLLFPKRGSIKLSFEKCCGEISVTGVREEHDDVLAGILGTCSKDGSCLESRTGRDTYEDTF